MIGLIPARGGSKRISRKNIRLFHGKPLVWYAINAARESGMRVVVSTEDAEIAGIARECGADILWRPEYLAHDYATTAMVVLHAARALGDDLCCIYCNPFVNPSNLEKAIRILKGTGAHSVVPVVTYPHPVERAIELRDGVVKFWHGGYSQFRTQDCFPAYHDAGQFYVVNRDKFLDDPVLFGRGTLPIVLDRTEVCDIDTEDDWEFAEKLWLIKNS